MTDRVTLAGKTMAAYSGSESRAAEDKKLKKACADFESIFVYQLLQSMRKTVPKGGLLPLTAGRSTWEMMMDQHLAEAISRQQEGFGLQKMLYNDLQKKLKFFETSPINKAKE
ncbi:MAG TPA: rod-binding protein [Syntrophales bacterium]|nr:rod-binding protein [Syntrophales bacterium]HOL60034.1 rod-binding protein [Syntrophales bacterium]